MESVNSSDLCGDSLCIPWNPILSSKGLVEWFCRGFPGVIQLLNVMQRWQFVELLFPFK